VNSGCSIPSFGKGGLGRISEILSYDPKLKSVARRLRSKMTEAEQKLWTRLRRKQIHDIQFYRQKPIGEYIVDFYAPMENLVVEVDGSQLHDPNGKARDVRRNDFLAGQGLKVLRFDNLQVLQETDAVVAAIYDVIR